MGDCRHLHASTLDFDMPVNMGKSENLLHTSQHSTRCCATSCGCAIPHGGLADIPGSVSGPCACSQRVWAHLWVKAKSISLLTILLFLCPFFFCAESQSPQPSSVGFCVVLDPIYNCIVCLLYFPFSSLLMVVCFLFMCGIKKAV